MSFVVATPEALVAAAANVADIGSELGTAHAAAAAPTTGVLAAAADEVSTQIAAIFSRHALGFQQLGARAAAFHEQFVAVLTASASSYAAAEAGVARTLVNANAVSRVQCLFSGNVTGGMSHVLGGALPARPTGGMAAASSALLHAIPAAGASWATAIENFYNLVEPYVAYAFNLASWAASWVIFLGPQINYLYYLFEPIFQSALFNTLDWLSGAITFSQGLANFWTATTASINQFIYTEINWVRHFFPPLPPLPSI